jgi:hypothetical protein
VQRGRGRGRGRVLLEEAAERSRPRTVAERLKANARWFAQAAPATALAWTLVQELFDHPRPISAALERSSAFSATPAQRRLPRMETILGVALGIRTATALVVVIGDPTLQLAAIVAGGMVAAVAARRAAAPLLAEIAPLLAEIAATPVSPGAATPSPARRHDDAPTRPSPAACRKARGAVWTGGRCPASVVVKERPPSFGPRSGVRRSCLFVLPAREKGRGPGVVRRCRGLRGSARA